MGFHDDDFDDDDHEREIKEWEETLLDEALALLDLAKTGNRRELVSGLEIVTLRENHWDRPCGCELTEVEKLLGEALWYARAGDLSEATYRLEQALA